jgi:hypothetical protein
MTFTDKESRAEWAVIRLDSSSWQTLWHTKCHCGLCLVLNGKIASVMKSLQTLPKEEKTYPTLFLSTLLSSTTFLKNSQPCLSLISQPSPIPTYTPVDIKAMEFSKLKRLFLELSLVWKKVGSVLIQSRPNPHPMSIYPRSPMLPPFFFFFFFFLVVFETGFLCPGTHSVDQAGLKLRNLPASASWVLGLKECATNTQPSFPSWSHGLSPSKS